MKNISKTTHSKQFSATIRLGVMIMFSLFLVGNVSAFEFDNVKSYDKAEEKITIYNYNFIGKLFDIRLAEYKLTHNTNQCLINCYAEGTATLYTDGKLFSDLRFKDRSKNFVDIKSSKIFIEVEEEYQINVSNYEEVCEDINSNGTIINSCYQNETGSYIETKYRNVWEEYNFENLETGNYTWRIEGTKNPKESIDWIGSAFGKDLTEWAWWNNDWGYKKLINMTSNEGNISTLIINYTANMLSNFSDLRILNVDENIVLNASLRNKVDGDYIQLDILNLNNSQIYVYYGNSEAEDYFSFNDTYGSPLFYWYFDNDLNDKNGLKNFSTTGAVIGGRIINQSLVTSDDKTNANIDIDSYNSYTLCGFYNISSGSGISPLIFWEEQDSFRQQYLTANSNLFSFTIGNESSNIRIEADSNYNFNQIYYVCMRATKNSEMAIFVDGIKQADNKTAPFWASSKDNMYIMSREDFSQYANGRIDELGFWDYSLSDEQINYLATHTEPVISFGEEETNPLGITQNSPIDNFNTNNANVIFNCSSISNLGVLNITFTLDDVLNYTLTNSSAEQNLSFEITRTLSGGVHNWSCSASDNSGTKISSIRSLEVDVNAPIISVTSPTGNQGTFVSGINLSLEWTVIDPNQDTCFYDYAGINTTVTCGDNSTNFTVTDSTLTTLIFYANDTFGNANSNTTTWSYTFIEQNVIYNVNVSETSLQTFTINMTTSINILSISSFLHYNDTDHTSISSCSGNNCTLTNTFDIPLVLLGESQINSFHWNITIFNGTDSINLETSSRNQNVSKIHLEICNATFTTQTLNFTTFDGKNLSRISPFNFDGTFEFWVGSGTIKRNNSFSQNLTELNLCLSPNVTMKIDATINYDEVGNASLYTDRFYYFNEHSINKISQDIEMYLLESTFSTSFILKVQDENLLPISDALIEIHRFYPGEGIFRIVQIAKTDDNGKSIGFFETETVDYKFIIKKAGVILLETGQQKVIPETSPFTLTFNTGTDLGEPWSSQNDIPNLNSTLTWNPDNGIVTYIYIDSSDNFTQARLFVQQTSLTNSSAYITICNDTSSLSSATITCDVGNSSGFYLASSFITRTGEALDRQISFQIETFSSVVGLTGLFLGWFLILIASFMFRFNEVAGIWATTITIFLVNLMGLIKFGAVFVTAIFGISIILTWVMEK